MQIALLLVEKEGEVEVGDDEDLSDDGELEEIEDVQVSVEKVCGEDCHVKDEKQFEPCFVGYFQQWRTVEHVM